MLRQNSCIFDAQRHKLIALDLIHLNSCAAPSQLGPRRLRRTVLHYTAQTRTAGRSRAPGRRRGVAALLTMDALAAEIAKKRKQVDGAKGGDAKRRWVRTADLQQQRRKDIEASAARKPVARPVVVEEEQPTTPKDDRVEERVKALSKLPSQDVIKRLRQLGQPVTLFGETADERIRRLAVHDPRNEGEDDFRLRGGHEITEQKETKEKDDDEEVTDDFSRIRSWIKARLKAWESALESRSDADKRSAQGRLKTKTYKQTKEYI